MTIVEDYKQQEIDFLYYLFTEGALALEQLENTTTDITNITEEYNNTTQFEINNYYEGSVIYTINDSSNMPTGTYLENYILQIQENGQNRSYNVKTIVGDLKIELTGQIETGIENAINTIGTNVYNEVVSMANAKIQLKKELLGIKTSLKDKKSIFGSYIKIIQNSISNDFKQRITSNFQLTKVTKDGSVILTPIYKLLNLTFSGNVDGYNFQQQAIACSLNGTYITICGNGGVYVSNNGGVTFQFINQPFESVYGQYLFAVDMNSSGQYQMVVSTADNTNSTTNASCNIFISTDYGNNWKTSFQNITYNNPGSWLQSCAISPENASAGLNFTIYNGYFNDNISWFSTASTAPGTIPSVTIDLTNIYNGTNTQIPTNSTNVWSASWTGYINIPKGLSGTWTWYTSSDDASYLWIGAAGATSVSSPTTSNALINNGGTHGTVTKSGTITLTENTTYPIYIVWGNGGGPLSMSVFFNIPNYSTNYYLNNSIFTNLISIDKITPTITMFAAGGGSGEWYNYFSNNLGDTWTEINNYAATRPGCTLLKPSTAISTNAWGIGNYFISTLSSPPSETSFTITNTNTSSSLSTGNTSQRITSSSDGNKIAISTDYQYVQNGQSNCIYVSTNGGTTWSTLASPGNSQLVNICYSPDGSRLIVSTANTMYISCDNGINWVSYPYNNSTNIFYFNIFNNGNNIYLVDQNNLLYSLDIPYSPVFQLDASNYSSITFVSGTSNVASWGKAVPYTNSTSYTEYISTAFNGKPGIVFGGGDGMQVPVAPYTFTKGITVFVVYKVLQSSTGTGTTLVSRTNSSIPAPTDMYNNTRAYGNGNGKSLTNLTSVYNTNTLLGTNNIFVYSVGPGSWNEWLNNVLQLTNNSLTQSNYGDSIATSVYIGTRADKATNFIGVMAEVQVYNSKLSQNDVSYIYNKLKNKWGL